MESDALRLAKARIAIEAAIRDRHRLEHELKMAKLENRRLRTAVALLRRETGRKAAAE
jgi:hypothetical protein